MKEPATVTELRTAIEKEPKRRAHVEAVKRQAYENLALNELRRKLSMTQEQVAHLMGVTQENISQVERRNEILLSTLIKYIEALGGTLEVTAHVGDQRVSLLPALNAKYRRQEGGRGMDA